MVAMPVVFVPVLFFLVQLFSLHGVYFRYAGYCPYFLFPSGMSFDMPF
jgi:hypothetical protein